MKTDPPDVANVTTQPVNPAVARALKALLIPDPKARPSVEVDPPRMPRQPTRLRRPHLRVKVVKNPAPRDAAATENPLTPTHLQETKSKPKVATTNNANASPENPANIMKRLRPVSSEVVKVPESPEFLVSPASLRKVRSPDLPVNASPDLLVSIRKVKSPDLLASKTSNPAITTAKVRRDPHVNNTETTTTATTSTEGTTVVVPKVETEVAKATEVAKTEAAEVATVVVIAAVASSVADTVVPRARTKATPLTRDSLDVKATTPSPEVLVSPSVVVNVVVHPEAVSPFTVSSPLSSE